MLWTAKQDVMTHPQIWMLQLAVDNGGTYRKFRKYSRERTRTRTGYAHYARHACSAAGLFPLPFDDPFAGPFPGPLAATTGACEHTDTETE